MADKQKDPSWHQGENPFENASCCSYLFFFFFSKLMAHGNKNELEPKDIPPPHESNKTIFIDRDFEAAYAYEVERWKRIKATNLRGMCCTRSKYPSVVRTLLFAHGRNLWVGQSWAFVWASFSLVTPFAVRVLLKNISKKTDTYTFLGVSNLWALSFIIFVCQIIQSIGYNQGCAFAAYAGVTMRASLITAVYKKSLRLTSKSRSTSTSGEMVNMMSNDAVRVWKACQLGHFAWSGFLMTIAVMVILVFEVGVMGGLAGSVLLAFITPLVLFLSRYQGILRRRMLGFSDERIKVMGEVLSGIRVVKAYNWQDPLKRKVQSIRNDEIYISLQSHLLNGFSKVLMYLSPSLIMLLVFGVYSSNGGDMDISLVLTVLAFLNSVKFPMNVMPFAAQAIAEAIVSADRIGFFLNLDELPHMSIKSSSNERSYSVVNDSICQDSAIVVTNGCFAWDKQQEDHPTLSNININISKGDLIGIVGSVGSGKSSLIFALLKEMHQIDGVVKVNGNIAYCSQQAWIRNATVRDNILFGCPYDKDLYDRVLKASSLENDLIALSSGDATEIGERGINLSGGQKQRVSLARSLYLHESRDIFLLDDVLSAVDEETASFIFLNAISSKVGSSSSNANTAILKNKTRVLVMNSHLHLLSYMDKIIVLENGKIQAFDSLSEVLLKVDWLNELLRGEGGLFDNNDETNTGQRVELLESKKSIGSTKEEENQQVKKGTKEGHKIETTQAGATTAIEASAGSKLIKEEDRVKGHVKADTYVYYFGMAWPGHGYLLAFMVVLTFIISEIARILSDYMLSTYSNGKEPPSLWIPPYASVVGASSVFALLRVILFMGVTVYAGMNLHNALFISILGAHVRGKDAVTHFFDVTPSGRILNRFAGDLDQIDGLLPRFFLMLCEKIAEMIGVVIMCVVATPYFVFLFVPLGFIFFWCMQYYRSTNRALKRLEAASRSPILSLFEETVNGLDTIRGYNVSNKFIEQMYHHMNINTASYWFYYISGRWLSVRLDLISCVVVCCAALAISGLQETISIVAAGLALVYAMMMTAKLQAVVRNLVDVEGYMVSVERLKHYTSCEMESTSATLTPAKSWPDKGQICFKNVSMRYRPGLPLVLNKLNLLIRKHEKVGIVGRTGAGKSSIMVSLLRLVELAGGSIEIDGLNIAEVPLSSLRLGCAIIPQDPVLFSGTVRFNLDPFDEYSDSEIWTALEEVQLVDRVNMSPLRLNAIVSENGGNFSVGEAQLICIARALLRRSKIVLLDEATASCDGQTDENVQNVMREKFKDATVLTIAHRIETIIFYDKIAVISDGMIQEFSTPKELLMDKESAFSALVDEMGEEGSRRMREYVGL